MDSLISILTWVGTFFLFIALPMAAYRAFGKDDAYDSRLFRILGPLMAVVMLALWGVGLMQVQKKTIVVVYGLVLFLVLYFIVLWRRKNVKDHREAFLKRTVEMMKQKIKDKLGFDYSSGDKFLLEIYENYEKLRTSQSTFFSYAKSEDSSRYIRFSEFFLMEEAEYLHAGGYSARGLFESRDLHTYESGDYFARASVDVQKCYRELQFAYLKLFKAAGYIRQNIDSKYSKLSELTSISKYDERSSVYSQFISDRNAFRMVTALMLDESYFDYTKEYAPGSFDDVSDPDSE